MGAATVVCAVDEETCTSSTSGRGRDSARRSGDSRLAGELEPLARALYTLLTDGYEGPLRYSIARGFPLRDAETKRLDRAYYSPGWAAAQERAADGSTTNRSASPWALLHHLRGRYDVAIEQPSWTSILVLDLDCHVASAGLHDEELVERALQARLACDDVLARVLAAYDSDGEGPGPVVLRSPRGGYHVYLFHDRAWPAARLRQWHEFHLGKHGLFVGSGRLEIYPSGVPLRAPCGQGMQLLAATGGKLEPVCAREVKRGRDRSWRRDVAGMTRAFLASAHASRRSLDSWLRLERPAWDPLWGPWGPRPLPEGDHEKKNESRSVGEVSAYQHIVETSGAGAWPPSGPSPAASSKSTLLLRGPAWRVKITRLLAHGIRELGTRHDAVLKVAWYHYVQRGLSGSAAVDEVAQWLRAHRHERSGREPFEAWVKQSLREVRHYVFQRLAKHLAKPKHSSGNQGLGTLAMLDEVLVDQAPSEVREEVRVIAQYLATYADPSGRVASWVPLGAARLEELCGQRRVVTEAGRQRASALAVAWLQEKGVLALHQDYSTGRHVRRYTVWYQFGTGRVPQPDPALDPHRPVLGRRMIQEGEIVVLGGDRFPEVRLLPAPYAVDTPHAWWRRMFVRRAFVPGELWGAEERRVIPFPFRDCVSIALRDKRPVERPRGEGAAEPLPSEPWAVQREPVASTATPSQDPEPTCSVSLVETSPAQPASARDPAAWEMLERRALAMPPDARDLWLARIAEWRARYS
jgi:hypothetical protein